MNYLSKNPIHQKVAVIKSLTDYAILLTDKKFHHNNLKTVHGLLLMNNYPPQFITKHINKRILEMCSRNNNKLDINKVTELNKDVISFPYHGDLSENIKRNFKDINVRIVFRSESKLNTFIKTGKDHLKCLNKMNVIYRFSCTCGKCYVGQTKRPLSIRRKEHTDNFKLNEKYHNVISKDLKDNVGDYTEHSVQWEKVEILHQESSFYKRTFAEMVFIKKEGSNSLNKITDLENLNSAYKIIPDYS